MNDLETLIELLGQLNADLRWYEQNTEDGINRHEQIVSLRLKAGNLYNTLAGLQIDLEDL